MTRYATFWLSTLAALTTAGTALASDHIRLSTGAMVTGDVGEMTPTEVKVDVGGISKTYAVNQIDYIQFEGEPKELTDARTLTRTGRLADALAQIRKVKTADLSRNEVKQEVAFYRAILMSRLALAGSGSLKDAGKLLFDFETAHKNNWHFLEVSAAIGDLLVADGRYEKAEPYYARLAATPWPEYRMRAAILTGRALEAQQHFDKAIEKYDEALGMSSDGKDAESQRFAAQLGKASALAGGGKIDDAAKLINDVIANADPENQELYARAYVALGNCYKAAGKAKDALLAFLEVDLLYPGAPEQHAEALANLAVLWTKVEKAERATQARKQLEERYPHSRWISKVPTAPAG